MQIHHFENIKLVEASKLAFEDVHHTYPFGWGGVSPGDRPRGGLGRLLLLGLRLRSMPVVS